MRVWIATALIALLAALLWPAGEQPHADAPPQPQLRRAEPWLTLAAQPRFTLRLTSSRDLCTAGTLTEISWQISGGAPPYTLSIDGESTDPTTENIRINCGALTETEAADEEAALAAKTITATVTDSRGVRREAALEVARAKALPAPAAAVKVYPSPNSISFEWLGAGGSTACDVEAPFAVRWRRSGATEWSYGLYQSDSHDACKVWRAFGGLQEGIAYEAAIAALRDPIESESPEALQWTNTTQGATVTTPSGVVVSSTHDSATVRWNRQPSAYLYVVSLAGPNGGRSTRLWRDLSESAWGDATSGIHEVVFRHLPSDTAFAVYVTIPTNVHQKRLVAETQVRTKAAPAAWTPPLRGAQNLRASATPDSITVRWDAPFVGADDSYKVTVYHPRYPSKPLIKWVYRNEFSQGNLEADLTYRVIIEHEGIVRAPKEIRVTTGTPAQPRNGAGPAGEQPHADAPPPQLRRAEPWLTLAAQPRFTLWLTSSRDLCTAGTLTEISWQISGGAPPYTLSIDGESTDPATDNIHINCGALTEAEAADEEAALAAKTITAVVTDSRGVRRETALEVQRARALPPLSVSADIWPLPEGLGVEWPRVDVSRCDVGECFAIRWRPAGETTWTIEPFQPTVHIVDELHHYIGGLDSGATYEVAVATIRDTIERETPSALRWTASVSGTTLTAPTGLTATATHDIVTLRWNRQPSAKFYYVFLNGGDGGLQNHLRALERDTWGDASTAFHEVVFPNLPSDTEFRAIVTSHYRPDDGPPAQATATIRTLPAPSGHTELPRGPQNLRATATDTSIAAMWDPPFSNAPSGYTVRLYHPASARPWVEGVWSPDLTITFRDLQAETTYRLVVEQHGPVANPAEISVTTSTSSPAVEGAESDSIPYLEPPPPSIRHCSHSSLCE